MCGMNDSSPETPPMLSIVVCSHNGASSLARCLESLVVQTLQVSQYEVVVVDNASTDATGEIIAGFTRRYGHVRSVWEPRPGKSRALNAGTRSSLGTYIAFTDDDVRVPADWAERILVAFRMTAEAPAAVLGIIVPVFEVPPPSWLAHWLQGDLERRRCRGEGYLGPGRDLYLVAGANAAYQKRVLLEIGGFSEDWGPVAGRMRCGAEDTELITRLGAAYLRIWFDPAVSVEHWEPAVSMRVLRWTWRKYLEGVAVSRIEGTVLCSRRSLESALRVAVHLLGLRSRAPGAVDLNSVSLAGTDRITRLVDVIFRVAAVVGRIRGSRLFPVGQSRFGAGRSRLVLNGKDSHGQREE